MAPRYSGSLTMMSSQVVAAPGSGRPVDGVVTGFRRAIGHPMMLSNAPVERLSHGLERTPAQGGPAECRVVGRPAPGPDLRAVAARRRAPALGRGGSADRFAGQLQDRGR